MSGKFAFLDRSSERSGTKIVTWNLMTNHLNLFFMLGAGMILPSTGFGNKYFKDSLDIAPGWIPLFGKKPLAGQVDYSCSEAEHLMPCCVTIDLSKLDGEVVRLGSGGQLESGNFADMFFDDRDLLLVPAPLAVGLISRIEFRNAKEKKACIESARDLRNVDLSEFDVKVRAAAFKEAKGADWPGPGLEVPGHSVPVMSAGVLGGFLAMACHLSSRDDHFLAASKQYFDAPEAPEACGDGLMGSICNWVHGSEGDGDGSQSSVVFWKVFESILGVRAAGGPNSPADAVVFALEQIADEMAAPADSGARKLIADLKEIERLPDKTAGELLDANPKKLSKALILFFLMENCTDLLERNTANIGHEETLIAAMLFAAREGWMGMAEELRATTGLMQAVSHRMVEYAHRAIGTKLTFGKPPERPRSWRELFKSGERGLKKPQREAAVEMANAFGWDIVHTHIRLPKGSYETQIDAGGLSIRIAGRADVVELVVDERELVNRLGYQPVPPALDSRIRKML